MSPSVIIGGYMGLFLLIAGGSLVMFFQFFSGKAESGRLLAYKRDKIVSSSLVFNTLSDVMPVVNFNVKDGNACIGILWKDKWG